MAPIRRAAGSAPLSIGFNETVLPPGTSTTRSVPSWPFALMGVTLTFALPSGAMKENRELTPPGTIARCSLPSRSVDGAQPKSTGSPSPVPRLTRAEATTETSEVTSTEYVPCGSESSGIADTVPAATLKTPPPGRATWPFGPKTRTSTVASLAPGTTRFRAGEAFSYPACPRISRAVFSSCTAIPVSTWLRPAPADGCSSSTPPGVSSRRMLCWMVPTIGPPEELTCTASDSWLAARPASTSSNES